jgi:hypothetical protein
MKYKLLMCFVIIGVLLGTTIIYSNITAEAQTREVCPTCDGTGQISCPRCNGTGQIVVADGTTCPNCSGTGKLTPKVIITTGVTAQLDPDHPTRAILRGTFRNMGDIGTNATVNAEMQGHSAKKNRVDFPPKEDVLVSLNIDFSNVGGPDTSAMSGKMYLTNIHDVTCPDCHGTGLVGLTSMCPDCGGTGYITCPDCGGTGYIGEGADLIGPGGGVTGQTNIDFMLIGEAGIGVAAAVGVGMAAFMVVKKKRISEKSLRSMPANEFNTWVLNRISGRSATSKDISLGIDGYSSSGIPVMIKQSDDIGLAAIDRFAASLARNRAKNGLIVAFDYGSDAIRGKVRARMTYRLDIEMLTVRELMVSKRSY